MPVCAPGKQTASPGLSSTLDKQRALAVLLTHDEHHKNRTDNGLHDVQCRLSALRKAPEWLVPVPVPEVQADLYRTAQACSRHDVHSRGPRRSRPPITA